MREIWRVKFRTRPDEYVYVHGVPVTSGLTKYTDVTMDRAFCGREVPANIQENPQAYDWAIDKDLVNCPQCQENALAMIRNPQFTAGAAR